MITINRDLDMQGYNIIGCGNLSSGSSPTVLRCANDVQNTLNDTEPTKVLWHEPAFNNIPNATFADSIVTLSSGLYRIAASVTVVPGVKQVNLQIGYKTNDVIADKHSVFWLQVASKSYTINIDDLLNVTDDNVALSIYTLRQGKAGTVISIHNSGSFEVVRLGDAI